MYIKVKVIASSKKEIIKNVSPNRYIISVKEPRERNLANTRVREIISSLYEINIKAVRIISGHQSASKIFSINKIEDSV